MSWTLGELAEQTETIVIGDPACRIHRLSSLGRAEAGDLSFLSQPHRAPELTKTRASAVVVHPEFADSVRNGLCASDPYLTYARLSQLMDPHGLPFASGIDPSASIHPSARLAAGVSVGPHAVIAADVVIGEQTLIGAHAVIYPGRSSVDGASLGQTA